MDIRHVGTPDVYETLVRGLKTRSDKKREHANNGTSSRPKVWYETPEMRQKVAASSGKDRLVFEVLKSRT